MSVSHDAPSLLPASYLAAWEKRMAKARKARGPERHTRKALTKKPAVGSCDYLSATDPDAAIAPLSTLEKVALHLAITGGVNAVRLVEAHGASKSGSSSAIGRMKAKLRARGIALVDHRSCGIFDGVLIVLDKTKAQALLNEGLAK